MKTFAALAVISVTLVVLFFVFAFEFGCRTMPGSCVEHSMSISMTDKVIVMKGIDGPSILTVPEASFDHWYKDENSAVRMVTLHLTLPDMGPWTIRLKDYIGQHKVTSKEASDALRSSEIYFGLKAYGGPTPNRYWEHEKEDRDKYWKFVESVGFGCDMYIEKSPSMQGLGRMFVPQGSSPPPYVIQCDFWSVAHSLCDVRYWYCKGIYVELAFPLVHLIDAEEIYKKSRAYLSRLKCEAA